MKIAVQILLMIILAWTGIAFLGADNHQRRSEFFLALMGLTGLIILIQNWWRV